jgi:TonB family protein
VTLVAPNVPIAPSIPKQIARAVPKPKPAVSEAKLELPPPKPAPRQFVATVKSPTPARSAPVEFASLQPLESTAPVISAEPLAPRELPPAPIVVGKLPGAATATAPVQSSTVTRASGFGTSPSPTTTDLKPARTAASGFQNAAISSASAPRAAASKAVLTRSVEILKKPQPVYTAEARSLRLEGEVLLEVLFTAAAEVRVLRVIRGLGHGLDEAATTSASHIEFRPALSEGEPIDQTVTVHIRFQLAY